MSNTSAANTFVVINPVAGSDAQDDWQESLTGALDRVAWSYEIYQTTGRESLSQIVRAARERGYELFIAAGGDGTVSGVAAGLIGSDARLGIVPRGTGNMLARELGIPQDPARALDLITGSHGTTAIDAMQVGENYYVLNISVGLSSLIMRDTGRAEKRRLGFAAYVVSGLRQLAGLSPRRFTILLEGHRLRPRASEVALVNAGIVGMEQLRWAPDIRVDDGRLDLCIVRARTMLDYLRLAGRALVNQQRRDPSLRVIPITRSVTITARRALPIQADGEVIGDRSVHVDLVPAAVRVIVPLGKASR